MAVGRRRNLQAARRLAAKAGLFGSALVLALLVALAWLTATAEGPGWIGRRSGGFAVPAIYVKVPLFAVLLPGIGLAVAGLVGGVRRLLTDRAPAAVATGLMLGEPVRWRGRRGLRAIGLPRLLVLAAIGVVVAIFVVLAAKLIRGDRPVVEALFFGFALIFVFAGPLLFVFTIGASTLGEGVRDLTGTLVVTDRRIAWLHPWRAEAYRSIDAGEIVDVTLVEDGGASRWSRRGWVAVTVRKGASDVSVIDIAGLPDAASAAAAMRRLIAG